MHILEYVLFCTSFLLSTLSFRIVLGSNYNVVDQPSVYSHHSHWTLTVLNSGCNTTKCRISQRVWILSESTVCFIERIIISEVNLINNGNPLMPWSISYSLESRDCGCGDVCVCAHMHANTDTLYVETHTVHFVHACTLHWEMTDLAFVYSS
jgi:hypothetical protein